MARRAARFAARCHFMQQVYEVRFFAGAMSRYGDIYGDDAICRHADGRATLRYGTLRRSAAFFSRYTSVCC